VAAEGLAHRHQAGQTGGGGEEQQARHPDSDGVLDPGRLLAGGNDHQLGIVRVDLTYGLIEGRKVGLAASQPHPAESLEGGDAQL
jgi:hypothetical protein